MIKLIKRIRCKHEYHMIRNIKVYDGNHKTKKIGKCHKCGKLKTIISNNSEIYKLSKII